MPSETLRKIETLAAVGIGYLLRNSIDRKRLSPDGFAALADVALFREKWPAPGIRELKTAKVVFLANHDVEGFIERYSSICKPKVLIVGDGDRDWKSFEFPELAGVRRVFLQNSYIANDQKFRCLPIGIENRKYGRNGMPYNFLDFYIRRRKLQGVFFGPLGETHPIRQVISKLDLEHIRNLHRLRDRISSVEFALESSRWTHVLAPRGNGKDTHRFWETLYRGSIPVVESDEWSMNISSYGIPMETVSRWTSEEIQEIAERPKTLPVDPKLIPALWRDYWKKSIREAI
jgi:hypothetical protein